VTACLGSRAKAAMGGLHRRCRGVERSHQSMVSASAAIRSRDASYQLIVAAPAAGEAELPEFPGCAVIVVDRFVHGVGVDLAGPVTVHRRCDVGKQSGQLRLVVGAHTFAGGPPFSFRTHDLGQYCHGRPGAGDRQLVTSLRPLHARGYCRRWDGQG
jgi:hypothetical protein